MKTHLMLDFETLGHIPPNVHTLSLGATLFNRNEILKTGHWHYQMEDQKVRGHIITPETQAWWDKQSPEARQVFVDVERDGKNQTEIIQSFLSWMDAKDVRVWSAGAGFDIPILELQIRECNEKIPWMFWNHRCYRTIKAMFHIEKEFQRKSLKHDALADAMYQAECIGYFLQKNPQVDQ